MMSLPSESQENYVIECILQRRENNGKTEYLVKWENHSEEENTWELAEDLDCAELIRNFERLNGPVASPSRQENIFTQQSDELLNANDPELIDVVNHIVTTVVSEAIDHAPTEKQQGPNLNNTIKQLTPLQPSPPRQQRQQTAKSSQLNKSNKSRNVSLAAGPTQKSAIKHTSAARNKSRRQSLMRAGGGDALSLEQIKQNPFQCGYKAVRILGVIPLDKIIYFLIEFNGIKDAKWVPSSMANVHIPQMVIKYYEQRLAWDLPTTKLPTTT